MSRTFKIVKINNKNVNRGRYTTNSSPSSVAKKVFSKLYSKMKNKLTTFMIKETTQGSSKKVYGPYKGKRIKLKKPRMVKFKGTKELVPIRYETKIYKVKNKKKTTPIKKKTTKRKTKSSIRMPKISNFKKLFGGAKYSKTKSTFEANGTVSFKYMWYNIKTRDTIHQTMPNWSIVPVRNHNGK